MYQQTLIIGRVGRDPDMRYTQKGDGVCSFSVAVSKSWTDRGSGEKKEQTTWFSVSAWRQLGETCNQYVRKGMLIMVAGEIDARTYTGNDGQPRVSLDLTAREVKFLSSRGETQGGGDGGYDDDSSYGGGGGGSYQQQPSRGRGEEDIPF